MLRFILEIYSRKSFIDEIMPLYINLMMIPLRNILECLLLLKLCGCARNFVLFEDVLCVYSFVYLFCFGFARGLLFIFLV